MGCFRSKSAPTEPQPENLQTEMAETEGIAQPIEELDPMTANVQETRMMLLTFRFPNQDQDPGVQFIQLVEQRLQEIGSQQMETAE